MIPDEWDTFCFRLGWITGALKADQFTEYLKSRGVAQAEIDAGYKALLRIADVALYRRGQPRVADVAIPERARPAD